MIKLFVFSHSLSDLGGTPKCAHEQLKHLSKQLFDITYLAFDDGFRRQLLEKDGIKVQTGSAQTLIQFCGEQKPDIIHLHRHGADSDGLLGFISALKLHCKKLVETNVFGIYGPQAAKFIDYHIFIADFCLERVTRESNHSIKGEVLYFTYDLKQYECPIRNRSTVRIGRHSRNSIPKWHTACIESALLLKNQGVDFEYHVLGIPSEYKQRLVQNGVAVVEYPEATDAKQIKEFLNNLDIYIHGSQIGELHPSVIVEAFAASLPVITIDDGISDRGHVQFVWQSFGGYIAMSVQQYAERIKELIQNRELRLTKGNNGLLWVNRFFDTETLAKQYTSLLTGLLNSI